ncbi:Crp/Fnr family transcriptional regulator [Chitinimonas sp. PSY-7]|uniref:cyclic nucleotide-binding domain-containing protein n=1 Tax=Chitinimonas sp. PSY-7 TaxID=3459088 RepID=UPI00403FFF8A
MHNEALVKKLITTVNLFKAFTAEEARDFLRHCRMESHPSGTRLIQEGDPGYALYVLMSGKVVVKRRSSTGEHELARLGQGETFGELALLDHRARSASVETLEPVRVLVYERERALWTAAEAAKLYRNLALMLAGRLRAADDRLAELTEEKQAHYQAVPAQMANNKAQESSSSKISGKQPKSA